MSITFFLSERSHAEEKCYGKEFCQSRSDEDGKIKNFHH